MKTQSLTILCLLFAVMGMATSSAQAQFDSDHPVSILAYADPAEVPQGGSFNVEITALIEDGWHIYSIYETSEMGVQTNIEFKTDVFKTVGKVKEPVPYFNPDAQNYEFEEEPEFSQAFRVPSTTAPGDYTIVIEFYHMVCNQDGCLPPDTIETEIEVTVTEAKPESANSTSDNDAIEAHRLTINPRQIQPAPVRVGEQFTLIFPVEIEEGWHIYGTQENELSIPTTLGLNTHPFTEVGSLQEPEPKEHVESFGSTFEHEGSIEFKQTFTVPDDLEPGEYMLTGNFTYQPCTREGCDMKQEVAWSAPVTIQTGEARNEFLPGATGSDTEEDTNNKTVAAPLTENQKIQNAIDEGLWAFILMSIGAGFLALLTPCVYPMVPVTVSFFTKQAHQSRAAMFKLSSVYVLSIIGTFTAFGAVVAVLLRVMNIGGTDIAVNGWVNLFIAGIFIVFAFSLFGMFEIRLPSGLISKFSSRGAQGGYIGVVCMGLVFTMVSFTCTAAFVAALIGIGAQGAWFWPILGLAAFSGTLAFPFFFLGMFPSFLTALPGSGGFMHTIKVTLGFVEIIAAYKFLFAADLYWEWGFFTRNTVLANWTILFGMTGFYLAGIMRMKGDHEGNEVSGLRAMFAMAFLSIALYLGMGLFTGQRLHSFWEAYLPPLTATANTGNGQTINEEIAWIDNNTDAMAQAQKEDKLLFYFFTGNP